jgi:hypothetical protein
LEGRGSDINIDGHNVAFTDVGRGSVLLFVHTGFWSFVWRDAIQRLAPDFRRVLRRPWHRPQRPFAGGPASLANSSVAVYVRWNGAGHAFYQPQGQIQGEPKSNIRCDKPPRISESS